MGILVYTLLWEMQDFDHQPYLWMHLEAFGQDWVSLRFFRLLCTQTGQL